MSDLNQPCATDVDLLLDNARLRDELEPYIDDSFSHAAGRMPLKVENEYLASMLAWERAPAIPIAQWVDPPIELPNPDSLSDSDLHLFLWHVIERLYSVRIILECTDHLSDRQLYTLMYRDILPSYEKKVDLPRNYLHWRCLDDSDVDTWLRYYANNSERSRWQEEVGKAFLPTKEEVPYPRIMPPRGL